MKTKLFISLTLLVFHLMAEASDRAGNGGDAIICHSSEAKTTVELKDYWEYSQMINTLKVDLGPGTTYQEKVEFALNRLKKIDSVRAEKLLGRFYDETFISYVSRGQIPVVDDSASFLKVDGNKYCNEVQVAFQILRPKQFQSKVLIDKTIFMQFDEVNKAGLILHELIYEQDIKFNNAKDSDTIRWFNYIISSDILKIFNDLKDGRSAKYADLISERKIDYFGYDSVKDLRAEVAKETPKEVSTLLPLILPSNFAIVKSDTVSSLDSTQIQRMVIDIEDDILELSGMKLNILQKNDVVFDLQKDFQQITGLFSYLFDNEEWLVSSIDTSKGREFNLKLQNKSVKISDLEVSGDLIYSLNSIKQSSLSGVKSLTLGAVSLNCVGACKVLWDERKTASVEGVFKFLDSELKAAPSRDEKLNFSIVKPIEYKITSSKKPLSRFIQRAEVTDSGVFVFMIVPQTIGGKNTVEILNQKMELPKCLKASCAYKVEMSSLSFEEI